MAKSKKKKPLPPRVKRMKRPARLESARKWILTYTGKHLLRGYCNHYGVDWRCAAIELKLLGIAVDPAYIAQRERTEAELAKQCQTRREERKSLENQHWHPFTDAYSANLAGDLAALHDLQMREECGEEWEPDAVNEPAVSRDCDGDDDCLQDIDSLQTVAEQTLVTPENGDDGIPF